MRSEAKGGGARGARIVNDARGFDRERMAKVPLPAALFVIYALILAAVLLAFRGTSRSVGVSLARAEEAMRLQRDEVLREGHLGPSGFAAAGSSLSSTMATTSVPPGALLAGSGSGLLAAGSGSASALPPLDAGLDESLDKTLDSGRRLPEDARPGWEDEGAGAGEDAWLESEPGAIDFADLHEPAGGSSSRTSSRSLFGDLDRAMQLPSVRKTPPREKFEMEARRMAGMRAAAAQHVGSTSAGGGKGFSRDARRRSGGGGGGGEEAGAGEDGGFPPGMPSRASPQKPLPHSFSPEARLMLPSSFAAPKLGPTREAKTIYPSEDATYGAAEFDVVVSPQQQEKAGRFSMTPEERILATHILGA